MYTDFAVHDRAYITIVRWPSAFTREDRVAALVDALGIDPYIAAQKATHAPPLVLARVDALVASDVVARFRARRVSAFALTQAYLKAQPRPFLVKRLVPALGAEDPMYMVEPWRGESAGLLTRDIFLIVRAAIERSRTVVEVERSSEFSNRDALALDMLEPAGQVRNSSHDTTHILDLYMNDGSRFRCNADRLSFDVLGKQRGMTDLENTDKLALRLATEAPQAQIDTNFRHFRIPADLVQDLVSVFPNHTSTQRDSTAAFDFYSLWTYAIHRGLAKAAPQRSDLPDA